MNDTIPTLMGEPMVGGGLTPAADPALFGQATAQPMAPQQQQEVLVPAPTQQQAMIVASQSQVPRPVVPQLVGYGHPFSVQLSTFTFLGLLLLTQSTERLLHIAFKCSVCLCFVKCCLNCKSCILDFSFYRPVPFFFIYDPAWFNHHTSTYNYYMFSQLL